MAYNARPDKEKWDELHKKQYLDLNIPLADELKILMRKFDTHGYKELTVVFKSEITKEFKKGIFKLEELNKNEC